MNKDDVLKYNLKKFKKGEEVEITYIEENDTITVKGTITYTTKFYIELQEEGSSGNSIISNDKIVDIKLI